MVALLQNLIESASKNVAVLGVIVVLKNAIPCSVSKGMPSFEWCLTWYISWRYVRGKHFKMTITTRSDWPKQIQ